MIRAHLKVRSTNYRTSRSIINCVTPDNIGMKGLSIKSRATRDFASFSMSYEGRIETFISTLDDLLRCIQAADATLGIVKKSKTR
ncbi:hypothetical protein J2P12_05290 [Candidatus Bathyarchaeota archaeon]|nr:hypothetical protein [Candidatus Bathyarchaeota archaeon]